MDLSSVAGNGLILGWTKPWGNAVEVSLSNPFRIYESVCQELEAKSGSEENENVSFPTSA